MGLAVLSPNPRLRRLDNPHLLIRLPHLRTLQHKLQRPACHPSRSPLGLLAIAVVCAPSSRLELAPRPEGLADVSDAAG